MAKSQPYVLLVDDDPAMLRLLAQWLETAGYRVHGVRDGREALLVPSGDPVALAGAVQRLFEHPAEARALREAGRIRARRYDWDTILATLDGIYNDAIGAPRRSRALARA